MFEVAVVPAMYISYPLRHVEAIGEMCGQLSEADLR